MTYSVSSANKVQLRRDTATKWAAANPKLLSGEIGFETDSRKFKIGDGTTPWNSLAYSPVVDAGSLPTLGVDTTGNYVAGVSAGTGITVTHTPSEGSTATVALNATLDNLSNVNVPSPTNGHFLKYVSSASEWQSASVPTINNLNDIGDVTITSVTNGQILKWNGTQWINDTPAAGGSPVSYTAVADGLVVRYVAAADVANYAGQYNNGGGYALGQIVSTGVNSPYGNSGELFIRISNPNNPGYPPSTASWGTYSHLTSPVAGSLAVFGVDENAIQARVAEITDVEIGYLNGVTSAIQTQIDDKAPLASPTFTGTLTANDVTVSGNLTVSGTTTSINTETLTVDDNIIVLNNNVTASPTEDAGIEVERGTSANVAIRWNETSDVWEITNDGTTYSDIATTSSVGITTDAITVDNLYDVNFTASPTDGQFLKYVSASTSWIASSVTSINDIGDVTITSPAVGQLIQWDGTAWINVTPQSDATNTTVDAVGDLLIGSANDTLARLGIGTNKFVLTSNGTTATWAQAPWDDENNIIATQVF